MGEIYQVYGARGSGSVPVEAVLTLIGAPYRLIELPLEDGPQAMARATAGINPQAQAPAVVLPSGELITESAAILIHLADSHPDAGLAPPLDSPMRPRFLRWMSYIPAQIYSMYWIRDDLSRLAADKAHEAVIDQRTAARIADCWRMMGEQVEPAGDFLLGDRISVLDIYLAVVSRWRPRRRAFYDAAPGLAEVVRRVDADPRLAAFWPERYPFFDGWEG